MPSQTLNLCPHKLHLACWEERRAARVAQDRTRQSTLANKPILLLYPAVQRFAPTPEASGYPLATPRVGTGRRKQARNRRAMGSTPASAGVPHAPVVSNGKRANFAAMLGLCLSQDPKVSARPARTRRHTATRRQRSQRLSTVGTWLDWQAHGWVWCAALLLAPRDRVLTSGSPHLPYRLTQKSHRKRRLESALSKWTSSPLPHL